METMKIELATIQDVPALLDLQCKAFGPLCKELDWEDAPILSETLEHLYEDFAQCTTLKVLDDEERIIGSIRGHVTDGFAPASKFRHLTNSIFAKGSDHIKMRLSAQD